MDATRSYSPSTPSRIRALASPTSPDWVDSRAYRHRQLRPFTWTPKHD